MRSLDTLRTDHRELLLLCEALERLVAGDVPPDPRALADLRRDIARRNVAHLAEEARLVVTPLSRSPRESDRLLAREYAARLAAFHAANTAHNAKWGLAGIMADLPGYRAETRAIVWKLEACILWEETGPFRAIAQLDPAMPTATIVTAGARAPRMQAGA